MWDDMDFENWIDTHCVECGEPDELCMCGLLERDDEEDDDIRQTHAAPDAGRAEVASGQVTPPAQVS